MIEKLYDEPEIYRIYVPLPENPLKMLNSYVIKTETANLVIDTGFNRPECKEALFEGLDELEIDRARTALFITHLHSDHAGLVGEVMQQGIKTIYMGEIDYNYLYAKENEGQWEELEERFAEEGFPKDTLIELRTTNQAVAFAPAGEFPAKLVQGGDFIEVGGYRFQCVHTPGHTPGHICLYSSELKLLFSGDHVLFDITPNITPWLRVEDSLGDYLNSLDKIMKYDVELTLPGHRAESWELYERVEEIKEHHNIRLAEMIDIIEEYGEINAYDIASHLQWSMRGLTWEEFPDNQKWFATGETLSHLDYALKRGKIGIKKKGQIKYYFVVPTKKSINIYT